MNLEELSQQLTTAYGLTPPLRCELLRAYTNDVYTVTAPEGRFVLKVYGRTWRTEPEIRYEIDLLQHLAANGVPVVTPLPAKNRDFLLNLKPPTGNNHAVLFAFAPGEKPQPPFTPPLYREFGRAIAQAHERLSYFVSPHRRSPLDLEHLIDEPLALALPLLETSQDRDFLESLARHVKDRITDLAAQGLDWGPIHGDASLDNLHVTADGTVILYDFDSGGPGWRAADLQGWAVDNNDYAANLNAFLTGYATVRPLNPLDLRAAPYLTVAWDIWSLKIDLDNRILPKGQGKVKSYLRAQITQLRQRTDSLK